MKNVNVRLVRNALLMAATDLEHWQQLAEYQRKQMDQNLGWCPTQAGIDESVRIRGVIGEALRSLRCDHASNVDARDCDDCDEGSIPPR